VASVLGDVTTVISSVLPGSVLAVSVNAHPPKLDDGDEGGAGVAQRKLDVLRKSVGEEKVPADIDGKQLKEWGTARVYRRIIMNEIASAVSARSGGRRRGQRFQFRQLFNFHYQDGAKMLTVGGVLFDDGQEPLLGQANFEAVPCVRTGDEAYEIRVPNLTVKEVRHLDSVLPELGQTDYASTGIPEQDAVDYKGIYRYFPSFAEVDT
jgi:hypothetical protein